MKGVSKDVLVGAAALVLGVMLVRRSVSISLPTGIVPVVRTGLEPASQWDRARFDAALQNVAGRGANGAVAKRLSRAFVAHWLTETGRTGEYNYNVANLHPSASWNGSVYLLPGDRSPPVYQRAYDSLAHGVDDYVRALTSNQYAEITADLAANAIDEGAWYSRVREAGWTAQPASGSDLADYRRVLDNLYRSFPDT